MTKEYLEALNYVWHNYYTEELSEDEDEEIEKHLYIVENALKRLEAIDNANPSEALECVEDLIFNFSVDEYVDRYDNNLQVIKQALIKAEKEHKVLEVIKEKRIDIESFYSSFIERDFNYDFYSSFYGSYGRDKLTKEEFNSLKEVLE